MFLEPLQYAVVLLGLPRLSGIGPLHTFPPELVTRQTFAHWGIVLPGRRCIHSLVFLVEG